MASNNTDNVMDELAEESSYLSLDENGQRNWLEESKKYLDAHYPDWKTPQSTRMVPLVFPSKASQATQTGYEAEEKMFNLIEEFGQKYSEPMFVVQSYKFAALIERAKTGYSPDIDWVKGECDFLIIHRRAGLLFIEVKAGITQTAYTSGLKQIKKVKDVVSSYCARDDKLKKKASKVETTFAKNFKFVAMPNCSRQESFHCGLFKEDCQDVDAFKKWWDQNVVRTGGGISQEVYEALTARIVPITHVAPTLDLKIEETHRRIIHYTPKQLEIMLQSCPQQWITGPAGCGKTVLLIDKVKEVISNIMANKQRNQERVLVLCYYKPLAVYLSNEINDWFLSKFKSSSTPVKIRTYSSFMEMVYRTSAINRRVPCVEDGKPDFDMIRAEVEETFKFQSPPDKDKFDHIFVDEGQDFRPKWLELLVDKFHKKPDMSQEQKYQAYFWVMCDSNQHVQFRERAEIPWTNLNNAFRLTGVLRNTKKIFLESKKHFDGLFRDEHITLGHKEVGLNVKFDDTLLEDRSNGVDILFKQIVYLHREKVKKNDVIILSRDITIRKYLMENLLKNYDIEAETAEQRLRSRNNAIAVESIRRFKGLESKVVIVYDPEYSAPTNQGLISKARELLYIAMSRCVCYLVIVSTEKGCLSIKAIEPSRELMDRRTQHGDYAYSNESRSRSSRYESEEEENQSLGRRARSRSPLKTL